MALREDYRDDILDTSKNTKRKYNMLSNADGTVSLEDVTEYTQNGDDFSSNDVNAITKALNETQEEVFENLIPYPYDDGVYRKHKEVEYVVDNNGIVTVNGKATDGNSAFNCINRNDTTTPVSLKAGTYSLFGCPKDGGTSSYRLAFGYSDSDGSYVNLGNDSGNGLTITIPEDINNIQVQILITSGYTCNNLVFKPMLVKGSTIPKEYKPYSQGKVTRAELDEKLQDVGTGDGTVRYVNDTADENYDYIQLKKADGTWVNWDRGNVNGYALYEDGYNGGSFNAYAGSIVYASGEEPNVEYGNTMNISLETDGLKTGSVLSKIIDLTNYNTITLSHVSNCSSNNEGCQAQLFVTNTKESKMTPLASTYIVQRGQQGDSSGTITLDVSSINEECYIGIYVALNATKSETITTSINDFKLS